MTSCSTTDKRPTDPQRYQRKVQEWIGDKIIAIAACQLVNRDTTEPKRFFYWVNRLVSNQNLGSPNATRWTGMKTAWEVETKAGRLFEDNNADTAIRWACDYLRETDIWAEYRRQLKV